LASCRYSAACELMERLVPMSIVGPHTCVVASPSPTLMPWFGHSVQNRNTVVTFGWQCCMSATAPGMQRAVLLHQPTP
jgi:hypothetical protein